MKSNFARISGYECAVQTHYNMPMEKSTTYILEEILGRGLALEEVDGNGLVAVARKIIGEQLCRAC